ncbi:hypothetical protein [Paenibacillus hexagrammi]|uniref:Uncharacterized protein n=1 Tax=Paenibacillus hexagrammi TaxID=2908839 RepID=A0ABY3SMU0_9BACL|nr:hypothetical protein [Paenibacillus sp. YPD9-1]UJF35177.1 hypothetical protein L0M14_08640 [Paenibacillus sp. YPD9-1]
MKHETSVVVFKTKHQTYRVVALSAAIAAGCSAPQAANPAATSAAQADMVKTVKTAKITKEKIGDPIEQVGDVVSSVQLDVVTKGQGEVIEILKKRGEKVEKGMFCSVLTRPTP